MQFLKKRSNLVFNNKLMEILMPPSFPSLPVFVLGPSKEVKALISEALGQPIESVFTRFDEVATWQTRMSCFRLVGSEII